MHAWQAIQVPRFPLSFPIPTERVKYCVLKLLKTSLRDAMKKVEPFSFLFNICLLFVCERYIEAVRKLRSQQVTLHRTVHMTFVPGNFWIKVSIVVSCMEHCLSPWMVWWAGERDGQVIPRILMRSSCTY